MTFVFRSGLRFCSCGFDISNHKETATMCVSCRVAASPKKTCPDCGDDYQSLHSQRCDTCSHARYVFRRFASGQTLAASAVAAARRNGILQPPTNFQCTDCDCGATEYDHRDYNNPLDVDPVCRGCNRRRGSAKPKSWSFEEFFSWFQKIVDEHRRTGRGYTSRIAVPSFEAALRRNWPELAQVGRRSTDKNKDS
jgi:hypothetical protein